MIDPPSTSVPPPFAILKIAMGSCSASILTAFAQLRIADHLDGETKTLKQLVDATGSASPDFLYRFLRASAMLGLCEQISFESSEPSFKLTDMGQFMKIDHPASVRNVVLVTGMREHQLPWLDLSHAVMHGTETFSKNFGKSFWEYTSNENPEWMKIFDGGMTNFSRARNAALVEAYDFSGITKLVDVGGGHGVLLASILQKYPTMQGVVFDRPSVVAAEADSPKPDEVRKRLSFVGGNFFESVPDGGDAYLFSAVVHDWGDDDNVKILKNVHRAMAPGGRLLVSESIVAKSNAPDQSKISDLSMMVIHPGGRERTEDEFARLYERSGFKISRIVPTKAFHCVIEGVRV